MEVADEIARKIEDGGREFKKTVLSGLEEAVVQLQLGHGKSAQCARPDLERQWRT